jgi:mercuric ion transport protein
MEDTGERPRIAMASTAGAVLSAFVATLCCVGPLILALAGLGGAGLLTKFEPLRPYLTVATVGLLGLGFYFSYRKPRAGAATGVACDCPAPRASRMGRVMLWVGAALVAVLLGAPYLIEWVFV